VLLKESKIKMSLAVAMSFILTPLWLLIVYLRWDFVDIDFVLAAAIFNKWPWFKGACALSTLTFLFPFFAHWSCRGNYQAFSGEIIAYGFGLVWIPVLMMYPGTKALGVFSDSKLVWAAFPICLIHYFCARLIGREIKRSEDQAYE
jgi:hypothetical protein